MSARDDILGAVRAALGTRSTPAVVRIPDVPRPVPPQDVVGLFAERVADYRAEVVRCAGDAIAAAIPPGARVVVPEGLPWDVAGAVPDGGLSAAALDALDGVVTTAAVGIAETGTIVLTHGPGQGRRALTLVPDLHVCVVEAGQVVAGVPEAVGRLDPAHPTTWISGPSATSDIELSRVEGVHGPRRLHVIIAG